MRLAAQKNTWIPGLGNRETWGTRRKRVEKLRYMHRNPVERGLVESPEQWRWSSFRFYFLGEAGAVKVNDWAVLKMKIRAPAVKTKP